MNDDRTAWYAKAAMPLDGLKRCLRWAFLRIEAGLSVVFGPHLNPIPQLGSLGWFLFWIVTASGIYVYIFFDTGVTQAWESLEHLSRNQWYLGGLMRSLHRYASDALVVVVMVHLTREFAFDRMRGNRWFPWLTGVPLLWFMYACGITGYWLVWDRLAQYVAVATSEWIDSIGIFAAPIARNFLDSERLSGRFFTLVIYMHIALPLLMLLFMWVHIQRHAHARVNPPRGLALGTLGARDSAGVVAFDVEPRLLEPLAPAPAVKRALSGNWPISARGGTRLAPAIELAAGQLEASGPGRRILVVVTDGFVDDAPLESLRGRLEAARVETIALAVGPDADAATLERLTGTDGGIVLRVAEAAELPATMSTGLERRRARIERGAIDVKADSLPEVLSGIGPQWPPIAAYAVTRPRPEATAWTRSALGDPVIAAWQAGAGRVVAVTSGLGAWTPQWLRWNAWPELAGGLVDWVTGDAAPGTSAIRVSDLPDGLRVELDESRGGKWSTAGSTHVTVETPTGRTRDVELVPVAPGRLAGAVLATEPGPYLLVAAGESGVQRLLHLRSSRAEQEGWGVDPRVEQWIRAGLLRRWNPAATESSPLRYARRDTVPDRWLMGLALLVFSASIVVDRLRGGAVQAASEAWLAIRRAWSRSMRPKPSRS